MTYHGIDLVSAPNTANWVCHHSELSDNSKLAPTTLQRVPKVGVLCLASHPDLAISSDNLIALHVVRSEPLRSVRLQSLAIFTEESLRAQC